MTTNYFTKINIENTEIMLRSDGIVQVSTTDRSYSESDIRAIHRAILEIKKGEKVLSLFIPSPYTSMETDARQFLSSLEAGMPFIAKAYIIKSLSHRLLANFIIRWRNYSLPIKFFKETDPAIEWLKSFQTESEGQARISKNNESLI